MLGRKNILSTLLFEILSFLPFCYFVKHHAYSSFYSGYVVFRSLLDELSKKGFTLATSKKA